MYIKSENKVGTGKDAKSLARLVDRYRFQSIYGLRAFASADFSPARKNIASHSNITS